MSLAIWVILSVAAFIWASLFGEASSSTLREHSPINKRTQFVLECGHVRVPAGWTAFQQFHTMSELCGNYPLGFGAECNGPQIFYREPHGPNWDLHVRDRGFVRDVCDIGCHCVDIAPDVPTPQEGAGARNAQCISDEEDDPVVPSSIQNPPTQAVVAEQPQCSNDRPTEPQRHPEFAEPATCSSFYGSPLAIDCMAAIKLLPDYGANHDHPHLREYLAIAAGNNAISHFPQIQTPLLRTIGTCTVAVLLPEGEDMRTRMVVDSRTLIPRAVGVAYKCAMGLGQGGFSPSYQQLPRTAVPYIYIYGSNSDMDRWLKLKLACVSAKKQKAECDADSLRPPKVPKTEFKDLGSSCSGTCMNPSDCDIKSDCVCASNKGIPLSSTWGQYVCTYIIGAATILASSAIKPANVCRGRCLLKDGTLSVSAANTSNISNSFDLSLANLTASSSTTAVSDLAPVDSGAPAIPTANDSLASDNLSPLPSDIPLSNIIFEDHSSAVLTCPCNCTYVSAACCGSRTVWENSSKQIQMDPLPANTSICCDRVSGEWLPQSIRCTTSTQKDSTPGFVPIGTARYDPSGRQLGGGLH